MIEFLNEHVVVTSLLISLVIQTIFFVIAFLLKIDKFTDITYASSFALLAFISLLIGGNATVYKVVLVLMVTSWALRLGGFLLYRVMQTGKDERFDQMRDNFVKFGTFWLIQAITVWVVSLAFIVVLAKDERLTFGAVSIVGFIVWLIGLAIEAAADFQKSAFKANPANRGKWVDTGLWKYSRHPNYLGEITCWIGVFVYCSTALDGIEFLTAISPIFIFLLIRFVSGVPILEKKYNERYKNDAKYAEYKKKTGLLIPGIKF